ncbi:MAG: extracellular solute-binding protein [Candidatus Hadarchaeum sp.]|uniref:ABC transporter substrate-binding protein n=1 Tax=Candidatus Hadarchaeum sp. TaxID=2883567 RepID=UPI00318092FC
MKTWLRAFFVIVSAGLVWVVGAQAASVTITYASWWFLEVGRADVLRGIIEAFEAENPDIEVKMVEIPYAQFNTKLVTEFEAGAGPDIFSIQHEALIPWIQKGYLEPLNGYLTQEEMLSWDKIFIHFYEEAKSGGIVYALPFEFVNYAGLIYNRRILEAAGLNYPPRTPQELIQFSERIVASGAAPIGLIYFIDPANPYYLVGGGLMRAMFGFNARFTDENGNFTVNTPEFLAAVKFMKQIYDSPATPVIPMGVQREAFNKGQAAMTIDGSYYMSIVKAANPEHFEDYAVAPLPFAHRYHKAECNMHGINKNSSPEKKLAAARLLKFLVSRNVQLKWARECFVGPARTDVGIELVDVYPWYRVYFEAAPYAVSPYVTGHEAETLEIRAFVADYITRILLGLVSPEQGLEELQRDLATTFGRKE